MENPEVIKWRKPNGNEIETNGEKATIAYCVSLGWEPLDLESDDGDNKPAPKRRGRPKKAAQE